MDFVHLHLHTEYSLLDGAIRIKDLPGFLKKSKMSACAITDHGAMYGIIDFYRACIANGIKPVIGCEVYVAQRKRTDKDVNYDKDSFHLILLAKNNTGFKNLIKLVSAGFTEGFYYRPRIDMEILKEHSEGLIALSACLGGEIPVSIMSGDSSKAQEIALVYDEIFGRGSFFLELQHNNIPEQNIVNAGLINISKNTGIPLVATNDCHYLKKEDAKAHEILLCMQTGKRMSDPDRMKMMSDEFYVKTPEEMAKNFKGLESALENTVKIAEMCNVEMDFETIHLPEFNIPDGFKSHDEYLLSICMKGLGQKLEKIETGQHDIYLDRLKHELGVISGMGYTDYYLIVWDFIDFAKSKGIIVGPGRGSGAGSLAAYCLGITNIDPIKYELLFERFLNVERVSMPDFDIDFCYERRQEVIDYVTAKYGSDKVAQVITFGTLAARACVKDVARALDVPYSESDKIAKMIPQEIGMTLEKALTNSRDLKNEYDTNPVVREVIDTALLFEGMPRHSSTHAAGVVISGCPLTDIAPLSRNDEAIVVQYSKENIELAGLLKFDFLGLRTLTVMRETAETVKKNYGVDIDFDLLPMDDPKVYKMISEGNTHGVFQLESQGMTSFMKELKPETLEDIIAGISLFRPGPMEQIPRYIESKNDKDKIRYAHPLLEPILDVTYGCIVYQEQVMRIVRDLAGFSMAQSDIVRRAMSKKKPKELERYRNLFIYGGDDNGNIINGAINTGVPENVAKQIFEEVMAFAGYAFNKSHAAAYAVIGYYTGWLKEYYPTEFMASMLNSFMGNLDQAARYINACKKMGIEVLPPDINKSGARFTTEGKKIRFALSAVKNVGLGAISNLIKDREEKGEYKSFADFIERMIEFDINKKMIESLIKSSAFDCFNSGRSNLMQQYEILMSRFIQQKKSKMDGQLSLFDMGGMENKKDFEIENIIAEFKNLSEYPKDQLLSMEKEVLGLYVSGHPLDEFIQIIDKRVSCDSLAFNVSEENSLNTHLHAGQRLCDNQRVTMAGICVQRKNKTTKRNDVMSFLTFEDINGRFECIVFSKVLSEYSSIINEGNVLIMRGRVSVREDEIPTLIAESFALIESEESDLKSFPPVYKSLFDEGENGQAKPENTDYSQYFCETSQKRDDTFKFKSAEKNLVLTLDENMQNNTLQRLDALLEFFEGDMPVKLVSKKTGKMIENMQKHKITFNNDTLTVLMKIIGKDGIRLE